MNQLDRLLVVSCAMEGGAEQKPDLYGGPGTSENVGVGVGGGVEFKDWGKGKVRPFLFRKKGGWR